MKHTSVFPLAAALFISAVIPASTNADWLQFRGTGSNGLADDSAKPLTKFDGENVVTNGGRVLGVTALGESVATAKLQAYRAVKCIRWDGAWCRKDISDKALLEK